VGGRKRKGANLGGSLCCRSCARTLARSLVADNSRADGEGGGGRGRAAARGDCAAIDLVDGAKRRRLRRGKMGGGRLPPAPPPHPRSVPRIKRARGNVTFTEGERRPSVRGYDPRDGRARVLFAST